MQDFKYQPGEKILCFHGILLYEAQCLEVKLESGRCLYYVHYRGWNKTWDEWVNDSRIVAYNEEGLRKQHELKKFYQKNKEKLKPLTKSELKDQTAPPPEAIQQLIKMDQECIALSEDESMRDSEDMGSNSTSDGQPEKRYIAEVPLVLHQPVITLPPMPRMTTPGAFASAARKRFRGGATSTASHQRRGSSTGSAALPAAHRRLQADSHNSHHPKPIKRQHAPTTQPQTKERIVEAKPVPATVSSSVSSVAPVAPILHNVELGLQLPPELNDWLVDDWDLINRQSKLHRLPAKTPISQILQDYREWRSEQPETSLIGHMTTEVHEEFLNGLTSYFNICLGSKLLFRFERVQYSDLLRAYKPFSPVDVYGAAHLLRFFVKLNSCGITEEVSRQALTLVCTDIIRFMSKHEEKYFTLRNYMSTTNAYQRRAV